MTTPPEEYKQQIMLLEQKLLNAFAAKDLLLIDELLHNDSLFVLPNGQAVTKAMVMDNYRAGNSAFSTIIAGDQLIHIVGDTAVVSFSLELKGRYFEEAVSALFRYIRVWKSDQGQWKVIAVSGVPVAKNNSED
ncbi:MAG: nuclear transport factor 2 family protein [Bacteroidia bacterium]